jgi:hypothetical protein
MTGIYDGDTIYDIRGMNNDITIYEERRMIIDKSRRAAGKVKG